MSDMGSMVRKILFYGLLSGILVTVSVLVDTNVARRPVQDEDNAAPAWSVRFKGHRRLLSDDDNVNVTTTASVGNTSVHEGEAECVPPAYEGFPPDGFTKEQKRKGAFVVQLLISVYMFAALAVVCDVYFVSALDKICEQLHLSEDVAGATFMAAGSSAPELFTSIIGVFIAKGDVGVGTIVGSAVFNLLCVVGICGVFAGQVLELVWFPLLRDSLFYSLSVITLILVIQDTWVTWYESLMMMLLYVIYTIFMKFNEPIQAKCQSLVARCKSRRDSTDSVASARLKKNGAAKIYDNNNKTDEAAEACAPLNPDIVVNGAETTPRYDVDEYVLSHPPEKISMGDACLRVMMTSEFKPLTRFRCGASVVLVEGRRLRRQTESLRQLRMKTLSFDNDTESYHQAVRQSNSLGVNPQPEVANSSEEIHRSAMFKVSIEVEEIDELCSVPHPRRDGCWSLVKWLLMLPINSLLYVTVPDCRKPKWAKWYIGTFIVSIVWIAVFSYIMVWMVTGVGFAFNIPDSVMGITFLAAGTSVPDAMASLIVARQGSGDMAVSNTVGSNIFDILIGLAFPWFIRSAAVHPGSSVRINSRGLVTASVLLFATVVIMIVSVHVNKWRLNRRLGIFSLVCYVVFIVFACMIELNVFSFVNPPVCVR